MTFQDKAPLWLKQILFPSLRQHKQLVVFKRAAILVWILLKKKKRAKTCISVSRSENRTLSRTPESNSSKKSLLQSEKEEKISEEW